MTRAMDSATWKEGGVDAAVIIGNREGMKAMRVLLTVRMVRDRSKHVAEP